MSPKLSRRRKIWLWIGATALLALCFASHEGIACTFADASPALSPVSPDIFAEKDSSPEQRAELLALLGEGQRRVAETYGSPAGAPTVISIRSDVSRFWFGANDYAKTIFVPHRACVVLGPKGHTVDIVAHELVHAEIFHRIGFVRRMLGVPTWFDEGAAMQVDRRDAYDMRHFAGRPQPRLGELAYGYQFFVGPDDRLTFHYALSKTAVRQWLDKSGGPSALYGLLAEMRHGASFDTAYANAERIIAAPEGAHK